MKSSLLGRRAVIVIISAVWALLAYYLIFSWSLLTTRAFPLFLFQPTSLLSEPLNPSALCLGCHSAIFTWLHPWPLSALASGHLHISLLSLLLTSILCHLKMSYFHNSRSHYWRYLTYWLFMCQLPLPLIMMQFPCEQRLHNGCRVDQDWDGPCSHNNHDELKSFT